jgi:hypothetical protein
VAQEEDEQAQAQKTAQKNQAPEKKQISPSCFNLYVFLPIMWFPGNDGIKYSVCPVY